MRTPFAQPSMQPSPRVGSAPSWRVIPSEPTENRTFLYQALSAGTTLPVGTRTGFTVTNVLLPTGCPAPGLWEVAVGIWKVRQTPPANGSLTLCPVLSGLEVSYTPNVPGSENVTALVNFTVEVSWHRICFPPTMKAVAGHDGVGPLCWLVFIYTRQLEAESGLPNKWMPRTPRGKRGWWEGAAAVVPSA